MRKIQGKSEEERLSGFLRAVFSQAQFSHILEELEQLQLPLPYHVRFFVLYAPEGVDALEERIEQTRRIRRIVPNSSGKTLEYTHDEERRTALLAYGVSDLNERAIIVAAIGRSEDLRAVQRFLSTLYPEAISLYSSRGEFISLVERIKRALSPRFQSRVQFASMREQDYPERGVGTQRRSVVEWMDEDWNTLLIRSQERGQDLQSIKLALYRTIEDESHVVPSALLKVTRSGELEVSGEGTRVVQATLRELVRHSLERFQLLEHRSLSESEYVARPLRIRFSPGTLESPEDSARFVEIATRFPRTNYAVIHGNPYVSVEMSDIVDGSSFSFVSLEENRLDIIPGIHTSPQALDQAVRFVLERFADGEVDYEF